MTPVEMLRARLIADPQVAALVGTRVYCDAPPQGTEFPFVVLAVENGTGEDCLDGQLGYFQDIVGLDIYSDSRLQSMQLWKECWKSLNAYSTFDSDTILDSVNQSSGIAWDTYRLSDASDQLVYRIAQNLSVNYSFNLDA